MSTSTRSVPAAALSGAVLLAVLAAPAAGQQDPPGNNGTVKVDGVDFDSHPNNEPHPGCIFQIDLYNYDQGDLTATIGFEAVAPTEGGPLLADLVAIGEDPSGGGDDDLDASVTYDLGPHLAAMQPHPRQGYHVQLTIHAQGSQGSDVKHKTFWVSGCAQAPLASPPGGGTTGGGPADGSSSGSAGGRSGRDIARPARAVPGQPTSVG